MNAFNLRRWMLEDGGPSAPMGVPELAMFAAAWAVALLAAASFGLWVLSKPVNAATAGELLATFAIACAACFSLQRLVLRDFAAYLERRAARRRPDLLADLDPDQWASYPSEPTDYATPTTETLMSTQIDPPTRVGASTEKGWHVAVTIPETLGLSDEDRIMAAFALRRMFARGTLYMSTVKEIRKILVADGPADPRLEWWLDQLHCSELRELPRDIQARVLDMLGRYLHVTLAHEVEPPATLSLR